MDKTDALILLAALISGGICYLIGHWIGYEKGVDATYTDRNSHP